MTGQEMYEHVRHLARDLDIPLWVCVSCETQEAYGEARRAADGDYLILVTQTPDEPEPYLIALHELGHIAAGWAGGTRLDREARAWRWAIKHSAIPVDWGVISYRLGTYARDRRYKRTPDFDSLLAEAEGNAVAGRDYT